MLAAYGIPTVPGRRAAGPAEAADAAAMLGFPVVLKVLSPDMPAQERYRRAWCSASRSAAAVREAAAAHAGAGSAPPRPEARIDGLLVQRQAARALELRLRLGEDAMFGPWIGFGQGGTAADLAADEAYDLPPLNLALAGQLIGRSRTARLMAGFRDHRPANRGAVAEALVRLSQLAVDFPEIAARHASTRSSPMRKGCWRWMRRWRCARRGSIPSCPSRPIRRSWPGPSGTRAGEVLTIRPIRPEDAAAHAEAFHRLDPEDVRRRFFSPLKEMSPALVARLTQIDYDREMAFIATRQAARRRRGDGRRRPADPRPGGAGGRVRGGGGAGDEGPGRRPPPDGAAVRMGPQRRRAGGRRARAGRQPADAGLRPRPRLHPEAVGRGGGGDGGAPCL